MTKTAVAASLPDAVGAFVRWLVEESGWKVTERDRPGEELPVAARHVCVLFRRFTQWGADVTRPYVEALEARGIPHMLVGGKSFHLREEVESLRTALVAIEWPDDELAVYGALRGPLFAVGDEALLEYRERVGRLHPFRAREPAPGEPFPPSLRPVVEALGLLRELHRRRNLRPVEETIAALLTATRAHAAFILRPSGEQALANVLRTAELARVWETSGGISFRGFVDQLEEEAEGEAPEAPIVEEGSEGVRIMTVHRAKGLEFPVVILADITANIAGANPGRWVDTDRGLCAVRLAGWSPWDLLDHEAEEVARDRAEGVRVAYVAATRARDLLVVPAVGDDPAAGDGEAAGDSWIAPLHGAIYPEPERRRSSALGAGVPAVRRGQRARAPGPRHAGPGQRPAGAPRARRVADQAPSGGLVGSPRARPRPAAGLRHPAAGPHRGPRPRRARRRPEALSGVAGGARGGAGARRPPEPGRADDHGRGPSGPAPRTGPAPEVALVDAASGIPRPDRAPLRDPRPRDPGHGGAGCRPRRDRGGRGPPGAHPRGARPRRPRPRRPSSNQRSPSPFWRGPGRPGGPAAAGGRARSARSSPGA